MNDQKNKIQKKLPLVIEFAKFVLIFAIILALALLAIHFAGAAAME